MKLPRRPRKGATLHALTAKRLIKELEVADVRPRQIYCFAPPTTDAHLPRTYTQDLVDHEEDIIALSETYSVLSRYTTFVAVEVLVRFTALCVLPRAHRR